MFQNNTYLSQNLKTETGKNLRANREKKLAVNAKTVRKNAETL